MSKTFSIHTLGCKLNFSESSEIARRTTHHIFMQDTMNIVQLLDKAAIIDIETGNVVGEMPKRALKLVLEWLELHKNELMENWRKWRMGNL